MKLPRKSETWVEAFNWWLENRAESPEYEKALAAKDLIECWLNSADEEIEHIKKELRG